MFKLRQITPFVPVSNLEKSVDFFVRILGFNCPFETEKHAYVQRQNVALRLVELHPPVDLTEECREQSCYIDVDNIDALYQDMKPMLDTLPAGRVRAPFDQSYGQREFHVKDEDALLIFFGEEIGS